MANVELDPGLKDRVVTFLRDSHHPSYAGVSRHRVAVALFGGLEYKAHNYLRLLVREGRVIRKRVGDRDYWVPARDELTPQEPHTKLDPELLEWVREFIYREDSVTRAGVVQEFFPGESHTARRYLEHLTAERVIRRKSKGEVYAWNHAKSSGEFAAFARPVRRGAHADCGHPRTPYARKRCRIEQGRR
ncbi:hypothetical protein ACWGPD_11170 [Streptomyces hirsutus]|uniref:hypothetical protein n=1 Tax=Streptomyces hirsutus TaxID=35620 RepID=UPI00362A3B72